MINILRYNSLYVNRIPKKPSLKIIDNTSNNCILCL